MIQNQFQPNKTFNTIFKPEETTILSTFSSAFVPSRRDPTPCSSFLTNLQFSCRGGTLRFWQYSFTYSSCFQYINFFVSCIYSTYIFHYYLCLSICRCWFLLFLLMLCWRWCFLLLLLLIFIIVDAYLLLLMLNVVDDA